jgi:3-phosphoshikimate 1-carboxyvinyltransferase
MSGALTSQYFSAMLTAAPCARAPVSVECKGALTEAPYLEITLGMLIERGVPVEREALRRFAVPAPAPYRAIDYAVEGDYSSAAFFFEAAAVCGIRVTVTGLPAGSAQGDRRMTGLLERMGCEVSRSGDAVSVTGGPLRAVEADMTDVPDLVPPLAVTAAFAEGITRLGGVAHLRHKESDRPAAIISELAKMGIRADCDGPVLVIEGGRPHAAEIDPHNDHRIAMSFAVAGLAVGDQAVRDPGCVAKSFPDFWERLAAFGA